MAESYGVSGHVGSLRDPQTPLMSEDLIYKGNLGLYLLATNEVFLLLVF